MAAARSASTAAAAVAMWPWYADTTRLGTLALGAAPQHHPVRRAVAEDDEHYATPTLSDHGRCWIYSPPALDKAPLKPMRHVRMVRFHLWKVDGFLYAQASCMPDVLALPVYASDGIGYPALSSVLRSWMEVGNERWQLFHSYMSCASESGGSSVSDGGCQELHFAGKVPAAGKKLDTRFGQPRCTKDWLYICQLEEPSV